MFTGLIEDVGLLCDLRTRGNYKIVTLESPLADSGLAFGDSVDCDGACLTVTAFSKGRFTVEASQETAARTILDTYRPGRRVNLERALQVGGRLGGHFVSGHVDCTGTIDYTRPVGASLEIAITFDRAYDRLVIEKGSIAVNGISLTVNAVRTGWFTVNLIPHSLAHTNVADWKAGESVNLEFDLIGKYIMKLHGNSESNSLIRDMLKESGW